MTRGALIRWLFAGLALLGAPAARALTPGPRLRRLRVNNGGARFRGDHELLTTVTPGRRGGRAIVRFGLDEPAKVKLEVVRTGRRLRRTIWARSWRLQPGEHALEWRPAPQTPPRTYVLRLTARAGGRVTVYGARRRGSWKHPGPVVRVLGIEAAWVRRSYQPRQRARLLVEADANWLTVQLYRNGAEADSTNRADELSGVPVGAAVEYEWTRRARRRSAILVRIGDWPSGLYYAKLTAGDGRVGFAPFVLRPRTLGKHRVAVVLPTHTWQAYNFRDADGDGWGDTWYAGGSPPVRLDRPYLTNGVPPRFKKHDRAFIRWLHWTRREVDYLGDEDLERVPTGDRLRALYDLVVFPGHSEYVTEHAYDVVERYRNLGGNLLFLSANNFFWKIERRGRSIRRIGLWRNLGRPESRLIGVQYVANDDGSAQRPFAVRNAAALPWLWEGTGLGDGDTFGEFVGGFGTEIDAVTRHSPRGTIVAAEIRDLFGRGRTAQMTYYETAAGARVFAAGALDFGGAVTFWPMRRMLENIWGRLAP